jgi:hypothetical protein
MYVGSVSNVLETQAASIFKVEINRIAWAFVYICRFTFQQLHGSKKGGWKADTKIYKPVLFMGKLCTKN